MPHAARLRGLLFPLTLVLIALALSVAAAGVESWMSATSLANVDLNGLTPAQKNHSLSLLRKAGCPCGCSFKLAECRVKDPSCSYSTNLAATVVDGVRTGQSDAQISNALATSKWARVQEPKLLDDPVPLSVYGAPARGPAKAPVTLVEFSDFQCPYCAIAIHELDAVLGRFPNQVRLVFKEYPLSNHPQAPLAAAAALAAFHQGKFWEMHDALFAHRTDLSQPAIEQLAAQLGLDEKRFNADLDSTETRETILRDTQDGDRANVEGTPTVFVNGKRFNGQITADTLGPVISDELKTASR